MTAAALALQIPTDPISPKITEVCPDKRRFGTRAIKDTRLLIESTKSATSNKRYLTKR